MNYCPSCGTANRDGSRFCNECGHKLPSKTGIICPMCSHVNPTTNVYCDNCQARLVPASPDAPSPAPPATGGTAPIRKGLSLPVKPSEELESEAREAREPVADAGPQAAPEPDETPDWLVRLRAAAPKPSETSPEPAPEEIPEWMRPSGDEQPDWFQRLSEPGTAARPQPSPADEEVPDWMKEAEPAAEAADAGEPPEEAAPDWLAQAQPEPGEADSIQEEEVPDWLSRIDAPAPVEAPAPAEAADADLPDWLKELETQPGPAPDQPAEAAPPPEVESADDVPNWLASMVETPQAESIEAVPPDRDELAGEASGSDLPDWLAEIGSQPQPETPAEETPEWLTESGVQPEAAEAPAGEEVPDWLAALRAQPEAEPSSPEETPDWLQAISQQPESAGGEIAAEAPEWLSGPTEAPEAELEGEAAAAEVPDWLQGISAPGETEEAALEAEAMPGGESLDWLDELRAGPAEAEPPAEAPTTAVSAFVDEDLDLTEPAETPDWLTDVTKPAPSAAEQAPASTEVPDWLRDLGPMPSTAHAEETPFGEAPPAEPGEIPEWLRSMQPGQAPPAFADEAGRLTTGLDQGAAESELEAAAVPSWLQALRPTDAGGVELAPEDDVAETEGILAGLRSVLPASPFMAKPQGAPAARQVQIPASELARAGLFQGLLARGALEPTVVKATQDSRARMRARVSRWLIAALMLAAAIIPNWFDFTASVFKLDQVDAGLYQAAAAEVDALSSGQRVMVAFDYDPFQAGEMDPIAEAFLTHISRRGAQVAAVSLSPTGLALANRVVDRLKLAGVSDPARYFPGQAVGAHSAVLDTPVDLVVVLAGSPDAMRWWVEQVAAAGDAAPVVAGVSAGALPQTQPYVQSGQIKATVNGLMGGLAYQLSLTPDEEVATTGFDRTVRSEALFLSQVVFAIILIFGLIVSLLAGLRRAS